MKAAPRTNGIILIASLLFVVFSSQVNAACSRDDVEFYLGKGFTAEQITTLCSASAGPASDTLQSGSQAEKQSSEQPSTASVEDDNTLFLKRAIKAQKINLNSDLLSYTQKICIEYGEEDLFGFTPKVCPEVKFIISLKGLEVIEMGKKYYFYGTQEVRVKSTIRREIIGELKEQKPEDREMILEKFEQGDQTAVPVRDDFSLERVKQVLQDLSL